MAGLEDKSPIASVSCGLLKPRSRGVCPRRATLPTIACWLRPPRPGVISHLRGRSELAHPRVDSELEARCQGVRGSGQCGNGDLAPSLSYNPGDVLCLCRSDERRMLVQPTQTASPTGGANCSPPFSPREHLPVKRLGFARFQVDGVVVRSELYWRRATAFGMHPRT